MQSTSEQEIIRRQKREELQKLGIDPYPSVNLTSSTTAKDINATYRQTPEKFKEVVILGRLMTRRIMGAASFATLQDYTDTLQLYLQRDVLCPEEDKTHYNTIFKKLLDVGDLIAVTGRLFITKTNAIALNVTQLTLLAKSLKPLPSVKHSEESGKVFNPFNDPEQRYRQRYVDLITNPITKEVFSKRAIIIRTLRQHLDTEGYLEVETPILQPLYGGANARPFKTFHHTLQRDLYLRIANELYLKRLMVGGYKGVYEIAKDFRNEGMSRFHNPEFTQLEVYVAYKDYRWMMEQVEILIEKVVLAIHDTTQITVGDHTLNFARPWRRLSFSEAIKHFTQIDLVTLNEEELRVAAKQLHIPLEESAGKGKIIDAIFSAKCEPHFIQPTFITDYPTEMSPLAKKHPDNPNLVERFEVICNGKELCNAFSEMNDPIEQRERFAYQQQLASHGDKEAMIMDEDFLRAMSYGMPPMAGMGLGIDRLTMHLTNQSSIQEVILFPQMREEN